MKKIIFVFLLFSGCMVGPKYKQPDISMPSKFVENRLDSSTITTLKNWWKIFDDQILNDLIEKAISNNYDLKIALEKIERTRAYYRIKKADLFPEINARAAAIRFDTSQNLLLTSFLPSSNFNLFHIGFDTIWEVDIFGRLRREKQAAYYSIQAQQESMRDVYVTMISDVARYYVDICALQNIIGLTKTKINFQRKILLLIKDRNTTGIDSKIKEDEEITILKEEEENLLSYLTVLKQVIYKLAVLLGEKPENMALEHIAKFIKIPSSQDKLKVSLPSTLLRNRPDIRKAEREVARANAKVGAAIADYFPTFSLIGNTNFQANSFSDIFEGRSFSWTLGSMMKWPIITFGRIKANVDVKKSEERQAILFYENTVLKALADVESSLVAYFNEEERLKNIQKEVFAISEVTFLENSKYKNGINNYINYLRQEKKLIIKKIKEIESNRFLSQNLIALYKALGGGEWD